jgi:hypothetical protein
MKVCKLMSAVAVAALVMIGAGAAKADGAPNDPKVRITVPTDPTIEPCSAVPEGVTCFTSNSEANPLIIAAGAEGDVYTDFAYEPNDSICNPTSCPNPALDALQTLWVAIVPTVFSAPYICTLNPVGPGQTPAFNECPAMEGVGGAPPLVGPFLLLELACNTDVSECTGMLPGEFGQAEVSSPEPGDLALLVVGLFLVGLYNWKSRKSVSADRYIHNTLAAS